MNTPTAGQEDGDRPSMGTPISSDTPTVPKRDGPTPATPRSTDTPTLVKKDSELSATGDADQLEDTVFDVQLSEVGNFTDIHSEIK